MNTLIRLLPILLAAALFCLVSCQSSPNVESSASIHSLPDIDTAIIEVRELPRPNSGTFSYEEAEKRKHEIYSMQLTPKYFRWKNPTSGGAVHINQKDEIEVYQHTLGLVPAGKTLDEKGDSIAAYRLAPRDTFFVVSKEDLKSHVWRMGLGNPASVLITSEYDLGKSKAIGEILGELFEPSTQIYYLAKK